MRAVPWLTMNLLKVRDVQRRKMEGVASASHLVFVVGMRESCLSKTGIVIVTKPRMAEWVVAAYSVGMVTVRG